MVWTRRVRTKSNATAVQLVESVGGKRRIVAQVGSAHDEAALGLLMGQARRPRDTAQEELDLGAPPTRVSATLSGVLYEAVAGVYD